MNTDVYLLSNSICINMKTNIDVNDQKLIIDQMKVSGIMHINRMYLLYALYIPVTVKEYIFNGYSEISYEGFLGPHHLYNESVASLTIDYLVLHGSIVSHGTQTNVICKYDNNLTLDISESNID